MYFKTRDGTMKDPEVIAFKFAIEHFITMSWDERGIKIHGIKDFMVEAWALDEVTFLTSEEWDQIIKGIKDGIKKARSYIV